MGVYFLDSSAVVKRYVSEIGSAWVSTLTDPGAGNQCYLAALTQVETLAAIYLRTRTGTLTSTQATAADRRFRRELRGIYREVALSRPVLRRAMRLVAHHPLRASDAIQLASILALAARLSRSLGSTPMFVSADQRLNQAALVEGLPVDNPNQHP